MSLNATRQMKKHGTKARALLSRNLNHAPSPLGAGGIKGKSLIKIKTGALRPHIFKATHEL